MHKSPQTKTAQMVLHRLVTLRRPHKSAEEKSVMSFLRATVPDIKRVGFTDAAGNLHVDMRTTDKHRTLFVAHVDTVHAMGGKNRIVQTAKGIYATDAPLGADDAAGVAILAAMIGTVPAYYIFTRGEECGGIGARHLADNHGVLLAQFDRAIAFDRKGTADVITHQATGRSCSDSFADALSDALNVRDMLYMPCDGGVYTDTAEFVGVIAECTNISTGYYREHSRDEWLDTAHWGALLDAALTIAWDELPTDRKPGEDDPYEPFHGTHGAYDLEALLRASLAKPKGRKGRKRKAIAWSDYPACAYVGDLEIKRVLVAAVEGRPSALVQMLAEHIHPEDPRAAARQLDMLVLSPESVLSVCREYSDYGMIVEYLASEAFIYF